MKINTFTLLMVEGDSVLNYVAVGEVSYTKWHWFRKKTHIAQVRCKFGGYWFFTHSGEFTPGDEVEKLVRSWEAKNGEIWPHRR